MRGKIHPKALISKKAELDSSVEVGPNVIIEDNVKVGKGTKIWANAYLTGHTEIGEDNEIHMGAVIGHVPQDVNYKGGVSYLKIGNRNTFREYSTVHRGTEEGTSTIIGNNCYLMGLSHVAHNCDIRDKAVICNCALVAGHAEVGEGAFISGGVVIHQYVRIGKLVMMSGNTRVSKDVPPFMMACERNEIWSINSIGMDRAGFSKEQVRAVKNAYKTFYRSGLNKTQAIEKLESQGPSAEVQEFIDFIKSSKLGSCPHKPVATAGARI